MDQLINLLVERTGISREQAEKAIETITGFLKERPDMAASILGGAAGGDIGKKLGGLFGR